MASPQGPRSTRDRRDRRGTAAARDSIALHDVRRIDARPHHDAHLGELRAYFPELLRERTLSSIQLRRPVEQDGALGVEGSELATAVRNAAIPRWIFDAGQGASSRIR